MNIRNAYDKELERIIEHNEYLLNPHEQPFKPSYLDYNYYGMKALLPDRLNGYERTIAQYHQNERRKIRRVDEDRCMELLKYIFPDIYKIKTNDDDYDEIDYHVPSFNFHIEHKERGKEKGRIYYEEDGGITFDKPKYDRLMQEEHPYLINSTGIGLFIWNLKLLGELKWVLTHESPRGNTGDKRNQTETNYITYLSYEKCNDLTYLLLQYN